MDFYFHDRVSYGGCVMSKVFRSEVIKYIVGYSLSLTLSLIAYELVVSETLLQFSTLTIVLLILAAVQMIIQVLLFLHVGSEQKPRWQSYSYIFTLLMVLVIVIGSIWIMRNLDYNMRMSPDKANEYMMKEAQKGF